MHINSPGGRKYLIYLLFAHPSILFFYTPEHLGNTSYRKEMADTKELKTINIFSKICPAAWPPTLYYCANMHGEDRPLTVLHGRTARNVPTATVLHKPQPEMCINPKVCLMFIEMICNVDGLTYYLMLHKDMGRKMK